MIAPARECECGIFLTLGRDICRLEEELAPLYPRDCFVRGKIRQKLQKLRELDLLESAEPGPYRPAV
ncbi:hypothetical protein [Chelativorans intermedius]|uniref:Dam-replacing protein HTH domain-containing protein n=1 Tax=Chelativorans intermedius TaxID=515947 RepID=A0ABV6D849_9HYPH